MLTDLYFFFYKNIFTNSVYFWRLGGVKKKKRKDTHFVLFISPYLYISLANKSFFGYFSLRPLSEITIYIVKMRLCNLIGECIVGKTSKAKVFVSENFLHLLNLSSLFIVDIFKDKISRFRIL